VVSFHKEVDKRSHDLIYVTTTANTAASLMAQSLPHLTAAATESVQAQDAAKGADIRDDSTDAARLKQQPLEKVFQLHPGLTGKLGHSRKSRWPRQPCLGARSDREKQKGAEDIKKALTRLEVKIDGSYELRSSRQSQLLNQIG
jgi:hypothetical protein